MMVYDIEFYAYLPKKRIYFFFISIKGRIRIRIFFQSDPDPWKKMSDPHPWLKKEADYHFRPHLKVKYANFVIYGAIVMFFMYEKMFFLRRFITISRSFPLLNFFPQLSFKPSQYHSSFINIYIYPWRFK